MPVPVPAPVIIRICAAAALFCLTLAGPSSAAGFIRDAEIEQTLDRIGDPIFRAAGLTPSSVRIYIVNDPEMNAFVAGGQNIFIHTGMLTRLKTIDQLRAVIAHETGHIAGGHLARRGQGMRGAQGIALLGMVGAAAVIVGGSPDAGIAVAAGSSQIAQRTALAYSRGEEASADQAGLRYVAASGGDPAAILDVLRLFAGQEALMTAQMDPYARSHPLTADRIAMLEERVTALPEARASNPEDVYWYDRMVAKLDAFLKSPGQTLKTYPVADSSETAALARAIAYYRHPNIALGARQIDTLIALRPDDPFYLELKGQFLLESGKAAPAAQAYRQAAALAPKQALILGGLGRALLNTGDPADTAEAREVLARSAALDKTNPSVLRDLALAEARMGNEGEAALATAERFVLEGDFRDALRNADRAAALLPTGSPGWRRSQDVITMVRRVMKKAR